MQLITRDELKRFAPRARSEYVEALLSNLDLLDEVGITTPHRLCHFLGQVGHETDGLTIIRESLSYSKPARLREVWPARFGKLPDAELKALCKSPVALGDVVYGGRMGNRDAGDGCAYRGGGWLQTTGRHAVEVYAGKLGIAASSALLDDCAVTLKFALIEWDESGCNQWADENDITKVSKAINTGSATGNVKPVGMAGRQEWFAKAWAIWGESGAADAPAKPGVTVATVAKVGTGVVAVVETAKQAKELIPSVPPEVRTQLANAKEIQSVGGEIAVIGKSAYSAAMAYPILAAVICACVAAYWWLGRGKPQ